MDHPDSTKEIPILDVAPYLQGTLGGREPVVAWAQQAAGCG
jgi:hypothetical protein